MEFPYGKAACAILIVAVISGVAVLYASSQGSQEAKPDLVFATFAEQHYKEYIPVVKRFEEENNCKVQLELVDSRALQQRLQSALQVGADVPDMVEMVNGSMGYFTRGPLEDVELIDLTDRVHAEGLYDKLVQSRFSIWSSRGRIFALPHDVHPEVLAYRRDLVEQLGIDVNKLTTWEEFARVGRQITKDLDGDGAIDRYMIDLPSDGGDALRALLLQRGSGILDANGEVMYDNEVGVDTILWYVKAVEGEDRISFPAGWGQTFSKAVQDGLCLFYLCPDWRTYGFQQDIPSASGKMALMPFPAWEPGGRRVGTWGGTGLAFTKKCRNFELGWKLAHYLYYDKEGLDQRFARLNILPPLREAWTMPELNRPREYWSGQAIGQEFAKLAPDTPADYVGPYTGLATSKLSEAFTNVKLYYRTHGDAGLREFAREEVKRCAARVREVAGRNRFLRVQASATQPAAEAATAN